MFKRLKKNYKIEADISHPVDQNELDAVQEECFKLSKLETWRYKNFCNEHKTCGIISAIGGYITIHLTPTGIGLLKIVECDYCKCKKNITDLGKW